MAQRKSILTDIESTLLSKVVEATAVMKKMDARHQATKKELEEVKAQLKASQPQSYPKASQSVRNELQTARATLKSVEAQARTEHNEALDRELAAISQRNAKALANSEYKKALAGSYADATRAIAQRRKLIEQEGITFSIGISGFNGKGLLENNELETFESFVEDEIEIQGSKYAIITSTLSDIGSSNIYKIRRIK